MNADLLTMQDDANQLLARGQFADALPILSRIAELQPDNPQVARALAFSSLKTGRYLDAVGGFEKFLTLSGSRKTSVLRDLARAQIGASRHDAAILTYREMIGQGATELDTFVALGSLLEEKRRFDDLEAVLTQAVQHHPANGALIVYLAQELLDNGKQEEALGHINTVSDAQLEDPALAIRAAQVLQGVGKTREALALLNKAALRPEAPEAVHRLLRDALKNMYGEGVVDALRGMILEAQSLALRFQLASFLWEAGAYGEAAEALDGLAVPIPENLISELRARIALGQGNLKEANAYFDAIWERVAENVKATERPSGPLRLDRPQVPIAPILYMPVEIGERELNSRIYIAVFAAQAGLSSLIAPTHTISAVSKELPAGVFLHKTLNSIDRGKILNSVSGGHLFAAIDEEAMAWTGGKDVLLCGVDAAAVSLVDTAFVAGDRHARAYGEVFPEYREKVSVVGNPRIDFLTPALRPQFDADVAEIRAKHGKFVLICTSFASINSANFNFEGLCRVFFRVTSPKTGTAYFDDMVEMGKGSVHAESAYWHALETMLPKVASLCPEHRFVIRVHPAESPEYWRRLAAKYDNIVVEAGGSLQPWLFAATAMIYMAGCSTGLEAFLADVPALRLLVDPTLAIPKIGLSYDLNQVVRSAEDISDHIGRLENEAGPLVMRDEAQHALVADHLSIGPRLSAARIAEGLFALYQQHPHKQDAGIDDLRPGLSRALEEGARMSARRMRGESGLARKRAALDENEVERRAQTALRAFGLKTRVKVAKLGTDSILISPAED